MIPLTREQTKFLLKLRTFTSGYTNSVRITEQLTKILEKNYYNVEDRNVILRTISWYRNEKRINQ